jgi:TonB family protein
VHVQPGQLSQSTLPKPTKLVTRAPDSKPAIDATSLRDAAAKISIALDNFHAKRVAVLDFAMPQNAEWNRVGQKLAEEFRADLATAAPHVTQISRDDVLNYMKPYDLAQQDVALAGVPSYVFQKSNVDAWVIAEIKSAGPAAITLEFTAHVVQPKGDFANVDLRMPLTPELNALIDPEPPNPFAGVAVGGANGYSSPACEYCPQPGYTDDAVKARLQGTVLLRITIEPSGATGEIQVVRGLPFGLSQAAENAVRTWRFKPALDRDGQPVRVAQNVQVSFRLF